MLISPEPSLLEIYKRESKGIPIGRPAEINLINNHVQYIFTWLVLVSVNLKLKLFLHRSC